MAAIATTTVKKAKMILKFFILDNFILEQGYYATGPIRSQTIFYLTSFYPFPQYQTKTGDHVSWRRCFRRLFKENKQLLFMWITDLHSPLTKAGGNLL
jgi:hypothetical protein